MQKILITGSDGFIGKHLIDRINKDFRCKAAHPYILDIEIAKRCRDQVRECINELILIHFLYVCE